MFTFIRCTEPNFSVNICCRACNKLPREDIHFVYGIWNTTVLGNQWGYDCRKGDGLAGHTRFCAHTFPSSPIRNYQRASESGV